MTAQAAIAWLPYVFSWFHVRSGIGVSRFYGPWLSGFIVLTGLAFAFYANISPTVGVGERLIAWLAHTVLLWLLGVVTVRLDEDEWGVKRSD
ncbi:MAG: hypothetical protein R3E77_10355 [Steroidobacteraceae bacterium]